MATAAAHTRPPRCRSRTRTPRGAAPDAAPPATPAPAVPAPARVPAGSEGPAAAPAGVAGPAAWRRARPAAPRQRPLQQRTARAPVEPTALRAVAGARGHA